MYRLIHRYWTSLQQYGQVRRVSFSAAAMALNRDRILRNIASPYPVINYQNEIRLTMLDYRGRNKMSLRESAYLRKVGCRQWKHLSEDRKRKYRELADNWSTTRKTYNQNGNLQIRTNLDVQPLAIEVHQTERKSRERSTSQPKARSKSENPAPSARPKALSRSKKTSRNVQKPRGSPAPKRKRRVDDTDRSRSVKSSRNVQKPRENPAPKRKRKADDLESHISPNSEIGEMETEEPSEELMQLKKSNEVGETEPDLSTYRFVKRSRRDNS